MLIVKIIDRWLLYHCSLWLKPKDEYASVKMYRRIDENDLKFDGVKGTRRMEDNSEDKVDPEPYIPTAFLDMDMTKMNDDFTDIDIITDDELITNLKIHDDGRMRLDDICGGCKPSRLLNDPYCFICRRSMI